MSNLVKVEEVQGLENEESMQIYNALGEEKIKQFKFTAEEQAFDLNFDFKKSKFIALCRKLIAMGLIEEVHVQMDFGTRDTIITIKKP